jgi:hypothetical protein
VRCIQAVMRKEHSLWKSWNTSRGPQHAKPWGAVLADERLVRLSVANTVPALRSMDLEDHFLRQ